MIQSDQAAAPPTQPQQITVNHYYSPIPMPAEEIPEVKEEAGNPLIFVLGIIIVMGYICFGWALFK